MDALYAILLVLHLLGWAIILGGTLVSMRSRTLPNGVFHGALLALFAGLALTGIASAGAAGPDEVNHIKIGVKLVITLVITLMVLLGRRRESVSPGLLGGIAGLTVVNVALAVLWGGPHIG